MIVKLFPILLIILDLCAAGEHSEDCQIPARIGRNQNLHRLEVYLLHGDIKHFIYWIAAATLTATVTF